MPTFSVDHGLQGIGGWLILVAIGLVVSPFLLLRAAWIDFHGLTGPNHALVSARLPGIMPILGVELTGNIILLVGILILAPLFFRESRKFPRLYQLWLGVSFVFKLAEYMLSFSVGGNSAWTGSEAAISAMHSRLALDTLRSAATAVVWITYIERSRRVKATFVH